MIETLKIILNNLNINFKSGKLKAKIRNLKEK